MTNSAKTRGTEKGKDGFIGFLRGSFQVGMGAVQDIQRAMTEIPLDMLEAIGVPEEKTAGVRDKHRQLLGSLYDSIDSFAGTMADTASEQVERLSDAIGESGSKIGKAS